ncbi:MAG: hypothetical protein QOI92_1740 [Chloroflexota bacterium]|nr:hypothetical protein [Chloroflexota bacterium]
MPSVTEKQRRFMGADLERLRTGLKTRTGMSARRLEDVAHRPEGRDAAAPRGGLPTRITPATLLMRRLRFGSEWL